MVDVNVTVESKEGIQTIICSKIVSKKLLHELFPCLSLLEQLKSVSCKLTLEANNPEDVNPLTDHCKETIRFDFTKIFAREDISHEATDQRREEDKCSDERSLLDNNIRYPSQMVNTNTAIFAANGGDTQQTNITENPCQANVTKISESYSSKTSLSTSNKKDKLKSGSIEELNCDPTQTENHSNTPSIDKEPTSTKFKHIQKLYGSSREHTHNQHSERLSLISKSISSGHRKQTMQPVLESELSYSWINELHDFWSTFESSSTITCTNEEKSSDYCTTDTNRKFIAGLETIKHCICICPNLCEKCQHYLCYVELHLKNCKKSECPLWKLCLTKGHYDVHEHAPERMVLFSQDADKIGTISHDCDDYGDSFHIGMGGFGRVYQHPVSQSSFVAVKEEKKVTSLISDLQRFKNILHLKHDNVLLLKEYVVGHRKSNDNEETELPYLLVMPHYVQRGLNEPFKKDKKCLLDYMSLETEKAPFFFRNILIISIHLFKGLQYFAGKGLVHRDIKRSNILLELTCNCSSAVECMCPGQGKVKALLSDFDLVQEATSDDQWARLGDEEPDGTRGMKAPELFFVNENGKAIFTGKADIWSAFQTIIHVLLGRHVNDLQRKKVTELFRDATSGIYNSISKIQTCIQVLEKYCNESKDDNCITVADKITVLKDIKNSIEQLCRFQSATDKDKYCPIAEVLTSLHGVALMPQISIDKVPHIFQSNSPLGESIKELWDIIINGMCIRPEDRPKAEKVVDQLTACLQKFLKSDIM